MIFVVFYTQNAQQEKWYWNPLLFSGHFLSIGNRLSFDIFRCRICHIRAKCFILVFPKYHRDHRNEPKKCWSVSTDGTKSFFCLSICLDSYFFGVSPFFLGISQSALTKWHMFWIKTNPNEFFFARYCAEMYSVHTRRAVSDHFQFSLLLVLFRRPSRQSNDIYVRFEWFALTPKRDRVLIENEHFSIGVKARCAFLSTRGKNKWRKFVATFYAAQHSFKLFIFRLNLVLTVVAILPYRKLFRAHAEKNGNKFLVFQ